MGYKPGTGTVEGTDVLSTGEGGGSKFLREDGDGTCSWQTVSGGSSRSVAGDTDNAVITWVTSDNTFAAEANATFNAVTNVLAVAGQVSASHAMSSSAWHGSTLRSPDGTLCMTLNNSSGQVHFANSIRIAEDQFIGTPHDSVLIKLDGSSNGGTAIVQGQLSASIGITGSAIFAQQVSGAYLEAGYLNINNKTLIPVDAGNQNTVFGRSGSLGAGNSLNVVVGEHAGNALSSGDNNVIVGIKAGETTTDVDGTVIIGYNTGRGTMTSAADGTVLIGANAGTSITSGQGNVAMGAYALDAEITGDFNTAIGHLALTSQTGVDGTVGNTAVGSYSGKDVTDGIKNTFIGYRAGFATEEGGSLTIIGADAGVALMTDAADGTTLVGKSAGAAITSGAGNTAVGYEALKTNIDGDFNTAIGYQALETFEANSDGDGSNTAVGYDAGQAVSTGTGNTIVGASTMEKASTVAETTAVGYKALQWNNGTAGVNANVAVGSGAGQFVSTACSGTFIGYEAGGGSFSAKTTGVNNTCVGASAGNSVQGAGHSNTFVGSAAGDSITTGNTNTFVGFNVDSNSATRVGTVIIGHGITQTVDSDNVVEIGNGTNSMTYDLDGGDITVTSDERTKKNIQDTQLGLEFINRLRPVTYETKPSAEYPEAFEVPADQRSNISSGKVWDGLIAQEVKQTMDDLGVNFSGWSENRLTKQQLQYGKFVGPLIKAIQELTERVKELEEK